MARQARVAPAGYIYHVLNRSAGRFIMLREEKDFLAFERILLEAHQREPLPILAWCLMGNHWHFVVRPREEGPVPPAPPASPTSYSGVNGTKTSHASGSDRER